MACKYDECNEVELKSILRLHINILNKAEREGCFEVYTDKLFEIENLKKHMKEKGIKYEGKRKNAAV